MTKEQFEKAYHIEGRVSDLETMFADLEILINSMKGSEKRIGCYCFSDLVKDFSENIQNRYNEYKAELDRELELL